MEWKTLYKTAGVSAFVMALLVILQMVVFFVWPPPSDIHGWFALFQKNSIIGLLNMDLLLLLDEVLLIIVYLALFTALRKANPSLMIITLTLGLIGAANYFASGSAFEMLTLSRQYSSAVTDLQKTVALTGGEIVLANWLGTSYNVGYILGGITLLLFATAMFKSDIFNRKITYVTLVFGTLSTVPSTAGAIGYLFSILSVFPMWIWLVLVGRRFLQLANN